MPRIDVKDSAYATAISLSDTTRKRHHVMWMDKGAHSARIISYCYLQHNMHVYQFRSIKREL